MIWHSLGRQWKFLFVSRYNEEIWRLGDYHKAAVIYVFGIPVYQWRIENEKST